MKNKTYPILLAFMCMGFGDVDPLVSLAKKDFNLSDFESQLIPFVCFIMFGFLSVPMGIFQDRKGKKFILLLGLIIALFGLVTPLVFGLPHYYYLLGAVLLIGAGASVLQVAGNPIMRDVSPSDKYARNLTIAQLFKAVGTLSVSLIPFAAARWWGGDLSVLFPIYSAVMLVAILWILFTPIEEHKDTNTKPATLSSCLSLLSNKYILTMVLGIFIYVGMEKCIGTTIPTYLSTKFDFDLKTWGILGNSLFVIWILIGRFLGSVVLNWMSAKKFLTLTALMTIVSLLGLLFVSNWYMAMICVTLAGLGCANIFPLIFSIAIDHMPERSNEISGLMVTAIVGAAFIPLLMGLISDNSSITMSYIVPLVCAVYILFVSFVSPKKQSAAS